jgi:uncharacterized protein (DUF2249 family)
MPAQAAFPTLDVRVIAPRDRHPAVFWTFRNLGANEAMELVNDHDPGPLRDQFQLLLPGKFGWDCVESGPDVWRVRITKLAGHGDGRCCGSCGGA